jgi:two-component system cell cycle sensor histidine kinase/response regulator CckA
VIAPVPLRLNEAVRASERLLRRVIGEDIQVVEQFQPDLGVVLCDPGLLDQVVMNLVVNAKDAMTGGGTLTLATQDVVVALGDSVPDPEMVPGPYVRLSVTDDGAGMSPDVMAHLFEPFFTTKETGKGTGLGLATVYGIVKQSNAFIDVRSTPGQGTTFAIYFPRVTVGESRSASPPSRSSSGGETILIIEDDATVRHAAERALCSAGYRVLAAGGGTQAIELLQRETAPLHLVLTDVVMHGQGGREVARRIAELRPGVRTLYMSGYTHEAISQHGVLDEGLDFLPKPFTPSVLLSRVRQSLDRVFPGTKV